MNSLLERLNYLKDQSGMNAKQLTTELGISTTSFTDWNKGKGSPSLDAVIKFSKFFKVSIDWLVYGDNEKCDMSLEYSSPKDYELLQKYHALTPELQIKLSAYMDGVLDVMHLLKDNKTT